MGTNEPYQTRATPHLGGGHLVGSFWTVPVAGLVAAPLIVLILVGLWISRPHPEVDRQNETRERLASMHAVVNLYVDRYNCIPGDLEQLTRPDPFWGGRPWAKHSELVDAWQRPLRLVVNDICEFEIVSYGANGRRDGFGERFGYDRDLGSFDVIQQDLP